LYACDITPSKDVSKCAAPTRKKKKKKKSTSFLSLEQVANVYPLVLIQQHLDVLVEGRSGGLFGAANLRLMLALRVRK
jgi:hypothetical protein